MDSKEIIEDLIEKHRNFEVKIKLWEKDGMTTSNGIKQVSQFIKQTEIQFNEEFSKYSAILNIVPDLQRAYIYMSNIVKSMITAVKDLVNNEEAYMTKTSKIINSIVEDNNYESKQLKAILDENVLLRSQLRQSEEMLIHFITLDESKKKELKQQIDEENSFLGEKEVNKENDLSEDSEDNVKIDDLSDEEKEALMNFDKED